MKHSESSSKGTKVLVSDKESKRLSTGSQKPAEKQDAQDQAVNCNIYNNFNQYVNNENYYINNEAKEGGLQRNQSKNNLHLQNNNMVMKQSEPTCKTPLRTNSKRDVKTPGSRQETRPKQHEEAPLAIQ